MNYIYNNVQLYVNTELQGSKLDTFQLDENSNIPLWVQLKNRLSYLIVTGSYAFGDKMPAVRELSVRLNIAYNTVSKVYRDLERDGLIRTKRGSGTFVTYERNDNVDRPDIVLETMVIDLVNQVRKTGMTDDELLALVKKHLGGVDDARQ